MPVLRRVRNEWRGGEQDTNTPVRPNIPANQTVPQAVTVECEDGVKDEEGGKAQYDSMKR
jgi:hypothetical protein